MSSHAALIYELEHVKEGGPALDAAVYAALGHDLLVPIPCCTTDLQAAVDLAPEGHPWTLDSIGIVEMGTTTGKPVEGIAATRAIAMCIAILRAVEAGDG